MVEFFGGIFLKVVVNTCHFDRIVLFHRCVENPVKRVRAFSESRKPLTILAKIFVLGVEYVSEYASLFYSTSSQKWHIFYIEKDKSKITNWLIE